MPRPYPTANALGRRLLSFVVPLILVGSGVVSAADDKARIEFRPPTAAERLRALGPTGHLPVGLRRALEATEGFEPVPAPSESDWLGAHKEPGQTFAEFERSRPHRPDNKRRVLYLQPLGDFEENAPRLDDLKACCAAFFSLETRVLPAIDLGEVRARSRVRASGRIQYVSGDIREYLRTRLPEDGYSLLGITMGDLYTIHNGTPWNFVFGEASLQDRAGVFSFARHDPAFFGDPPVAETPRLRFRRGLQVLLHETCHMFGMQHCVHYHCVVNGSNSLAESDSQPLHLCPVCLRKLQSSVGFDVVRRYETQRRLYDNLELSDEATWTANQLRRIAPR
jgi:archaemetzincin